MSKTWEVPLETDEYGQYYIVLPDELIIELGWEPLDELVWEETEVCDEHGEYPGLLLYRAEDKQQCGAGNT